MPVPTTPIAPLSDAATPFVAATSGVRHRIGSRLLEGCTEWWQLPALSLVALAVAASVIWTYRRDAAELSWPVRVGLTCLRLGALAALAVALLDLERTAEHEIVFPSRVAVLVDTSGSMALTDDHAGLPRQRQEQAVELLHAGGLLEALAADHEVSLWRFADEVARVAVIPRGGPVPEGDAVGDALTADGTETRLGDAIGRLLEENASATLAGIVLVTDGGSNAGIEPLAAAEAAAAAAVPLHAIGIGSEMLPVNVRVADLVVPLRVFPADRFTVTAYLQPQGLQNQRVRVELGELSEPGAGFRAGQPAVGTLRVIDAVDVVLGVDGELVPVRFEVPGLESPGRRGLVVRVQPPPGDRQPDDDAQSAEIEVVDRVTHVLLMAGGPGREYQFLRNVLDRDKSFAVDVLLGTVATGMSQDARKILPAFPASDEALADYDAVVAIDFDWRQLDPPARGRLERWVAKESGGLLLVAGGIATEAWLADPRMKAIRGLFPIELRRPSQVGIDGTAGSEVARPLEFTREGREAEFLWLAPNRMASELAWDSFPGVFSCFDGGSPKPGATVYARALPPAGRIAAGHAPAYFAGQLYGAGIVFYCGSGELWRLRSAADGAHERLVTQLVRHVSQGRLLRGARQGRLLVDRDRYPVGAPVVVRLVLPTATAASPPNCRVQGPDGQGFDVALAPEPGRGDVHRGSFVVSRAGRWQIDARLPGTGGQVSRGIQAQLPDRELVRPRLNRGLLEAVAAASAGRTRFLGEAAWTPADALDLAAAVPERSRREYETGASDPVFKERLNALLLTAGVGLLCVEWIGRRLAKLA
jgi:hypothetical protein